MKMANTKPDTDQPHGSVTVSDLTGSDMSTSMRTAPLTTRTVACALAIVDRFPTENPNKPAEPYYRKFERK